MQTPVGPSLRLAALMVDAVGEVSGEALSAVWNRWLGPQRFARKFAQLERAGLVKGVKGEVRLDRVVRLTEAGRVAASGGRDPEACWRRAWDRQWRMIVFDVQETKRRQRQFLQRMLRRHDFGYLQDSVWITPDAVDGLRASLTDSPVDAAVLTFLEARPCSGESDADLVHAAWDFVRINRCYDDYLAVLRDFPIAGGDRAIRQWLQVEWKAWSRAMRLDPLLPEALLPRGYRGRDAWKRRRDKLVPLVKA